MYINILNSKIQGVLEESLQDDFNKEFLIEI